jgi:hypothetical protein
MPGRFSGRAMWGMAESSKCKVQSRKVSTKFGFYEAAAGSSIMETDYPKIA